MFNRHISKDHLLTYKNNLKWRLDMLVSLKNIKKEEIHQMAKQAAEDLSIPIMYLQNNGRKNHKWDIDALIPWINDDIEE